MSISATEGVGSTASASSAGLSSLVSTTATGSADKDMFLQLLVAQLKYQDPSNPADTTQFMAQTAQFTALEKMQAVADQTKAVLAAQMAFGGVSMVGRTVDYQLSDGTTGSGVVSSVTFDATGPVLDIAGTAVPLINVVTVTADATEASDSTAPTDPMAS